MRWTLDDIYPDFVFQLPEPGNFGKPRTMPDSAANARTPVPKDIANHEGTGLRANSWVVKSFMFFGQSEGAHERFLSIFIREGQVCAKNIGNVPKSQKRISDPPP